MLSEVGKAVGQWIVGHVGWSVLIVLVLLSGIFKITKREIDPLGWVLSWFGKNLTKDVRKDVADLKEDYNEQITVLKEDLDSFEKRTNKSIDEMKKGTSDNCKMLKQRMDKMEKSNDMQTVRQIRAHVLDFANSCMNHRKHTKKEFENIIDENAQYEALVKKYRIKNAVYTEDFKYVMDVYHQCQKDGSFLNDKSMPAV